MKNIAAFFEAAAVAEARPIDGVHLGAESTAAIDQPLAPIARGLAALQIDTDQGGMKAGG